MQQLTPVLALSRQCPEWDENSWAAQPTRSDTQAPGTTVQRMRVPAWLLSDERGMYGVAMREVAWRLGCPVYAISFADVDRRCTTWTDLVERFAVCFGGWYNIMSARS